MKVNVLCDVDGILCNFYKSFASYLNEIYDANLDPDIEPTNYNFKEWGPNLKNIDLNKATVDWIMKNRGFLKAPIYDGAIEFVEELNKICNVSVVTARVGDWKQYFTEAVIDTIKNDTIQWFKNNNFPVKEIIFEHKKVDYCRNNAIPILIEDKLETVKLGAKEGIHSILLNRAWNEYPERFKIYRTYNYQGVLDTIRKLSE